MSTVMLDLFNTVRVILKFETIRIDNNIARLHYKLTVILLLTFSLLVTSKQYFGDPIDCNTESERDIDVFCWIFSTYTLKQLQESGSIYQGVGPDRKHDEVVTQKYYQWVCFVLALQAAAFYTPRHLWKTWESGRLKMLVGDLGLPVISSECSTSRKRMLIKYLCVTNKHTHDIYALRFIFCEVLNLVNVGLQIYVIDLFLGGTFSSYGPIALKLFHTDKLVDPMAAVFPKIAKCRYIVYGPSGDSQILDALCVLPLNIINEKIYLFLWFWLIFLFVVTVFAVIFRIIVISKMNVRKYLLMAQARHVKLAYVDMIVNQFSYSDWFVLDMLGKNINPLIFRELVEDLGYFLSADSRTQSEIVTDV